MIEIGRPYCDWIAVKFKDKRRGAMWLCKECGHQGKGKEVPKCPCEKIKITKKAASLTRRERDQINLEWSLSRIVTALPQALLQLYG